ncbi:MAG: hypothetical protein P4L31_04055 [Candidatus Babeliales bacterium]|nr:hypothetical protein [Candidatus Babeliales bacterium]
MKKITKFLYTLCMSFMLVPFALNGMNGQNNNVVHDGVHKKVIIAGALVGAGIGFYIDRTLNPQSDTSNSYMAGALYASFGGALGYACTQVNFGELWQRLPHIPGNRWFAIDTL